MLLHIAKIKHQPACKQDFQICEQIPDPTVYGYNGLNLTDPVQFSGTVTNNSEGLFLVEGHYQTKIGLICSRCLSFFELPVEGDIYSLCGADKGDDYEGNVDTREFRGDNIDISELVLGEIFFSLPMQLICSEECRGLCSVCGVDLNKKACTCAQESIDPRWEKLAQFKLNVEE